MAQRQRGYARAPGTSRGASPADLGLPEDRRRGFAAALPRAR
jgi:hypothetical protein